MDKLSAGHPNRWHNQAIDTLTGVVLFVHASCHWLLDLLFGACIISDGELPLTPSAVHRACIGACIISDGELPLTPFGPYIIIKEGGGVAGGERRSIQQ